MKMSCPLARVTMPLILFLVVCGTGETIDTLRPHMVLRRVDFPAEGLPMIDIDPDFSWRTPFDLP